MFFSSAFLITEKTNRFDSTICKNFRLGKKAFHAIAYGRNVLNKQHLQEQMLKTLRLKAFI